ncbi:MAG: TadE/TadG family type IV pilus assembly protein [Hyphomonadaceae bacterium]
MFRPLQALRKLRRFGRARRGSTAIEFAIVVIPFFLLTFGLAEVSMIGFVQTSLDFSVSEAGREIRTGEAQMNGVGQHEIEELLCEELTKFVILTCSGNLFLDVDRFDSFVDVDNGNPIQNSQFTTGGFGYSPGAPSDIVVVRAYYRWKIMTPMFEPLLSNVNGGERILVSTMMFRNEPYQVVGGGAAGT